MSNDDRLVPRDYPIPVAVRRPPPPVDPALLLKQQPPLPPAPAAPNIIYINNMPAPVPAVAPPVFMQPPPPAPTVVHHHHYTTATTQRISYRMSARQSHSALGMASLALGVIACVVCWVPLLGVAAVPIGAIGALLGVLGFLVSLLFRKSSATLPLTAVFICCLAAGISIASTSSIPYWQKQLYKAITTIAPPTTPTGHSAATATPAPIAPAPSLLDFGSTPVATPPTPAVTTPHAPPAAHPQIVPKLDPAVATARDQLTAAEKACDARTMQSPEYQAAVKAAADARAHEVLLRQTIPPGSADLVEASQDMIKADNAVSDALTRAQAADPAVVAARQTLFTARSTVH